MSLFHVSFHGDKGQRRVGGLGQFRSLGRVAWMLISSPSVMAESCQGHLVKCWVSFPSCGECMSRNWGLSHSLKLVGFFFLGGFWANIFLLDFMYKFNICYIVFDSVVHTHGSNFKGTKGIWGRAFSYLFPQPLRSHPNLAISVPRIHPEVVHWCTLNNIARCHMLVHKELSHCLFL